jgi:hypothetical protein
MNVRAHLEKTKPTSQAKVLKQPIFNNPLITNTGGLPFGMCGFNKGKTIVKASYTRIKDIGTEKIETS